MDNSEKLMSPIDKSVMPDGPWQHEPDRLEWHMVSGFPALILRNGFGSLCGYVAVPSDHPMHGMENVRADMQMQVHGGITFAGPCDDRICHVGESDDVWWFGFDACHIFDLIPGLLNIQSDLGIFSTYRDIDYMKEECEALGMQLAVMRSS